MRLSDIPAPIGAHKSKKIVGRGPVSGHGKTSTRGTKGAKARAGRGVYQGFEGGQMPLIRRIPKRGFTNRFRRYIQVVNVNSLNVFKDESIIGPNELKEARLVHNIDEPIKILGKGELKKKLTVNANKFSKKAKEIIEKIGGKTQLIC